MHEMQKNRVTLDAHCRRGFSQGVTGGAFTEVSQKCLGQNGKLPQALYSHFLCFKACAHRYVDYPRLAVSAMVCGDCQG